MTTHAGENGDTLRPGDPSELGPYRVRGRLGRGGMGTVYLGEDLSGRRVAIKVINRELAGETPFRERFRREVTAARQVRRFCTAPVIDAELDQEPLYIVTEYIEGPSLERAVAERGPLPGSDLEGLAVGVATALAAIHGAGIVHRDLKPANVLLSSTGPRVIDFGIARALDTAEGPTRTGQFVGTPNYLPPELLRGEPVTPASDVFSWGCVVAYAGTGTPPFAGSTVPEIFYRVAHDEPRLDGLDPAVRDVVTAALDKDPRNRPSVQELLGDLVGSARPDPATLAETVEAGWDSAASSVPPSSAEPSLTPPTTAEAAPVRPTVVAPVSPAPAAFRQPSAMPAADTTHGDAPQRDGGSGSGGLAAVLRERRRPLIIGTAAVVAVAVAAAVAFTVFRSDGPPDKLASVFGDDFSSNDSGWDGGSYISSYGYIGGKYRLDADRFNRGRTRTAPKPAQDVPDRVLETATVSAVQGTPDSQYGLVCRSNDNNKNEYDFLLRNDGKGGLLRKVTSDRGAKELANVDSIPGFAKKGPNKLQIACEGQNGGEKVRLRLWVNGEPVIDATDTDRPLRSGGAGLRIELGGNLAQKVIVDFDDYDLSEIRK